MTVVASPSPPARARTARRPLGLCVAPAIHDRAGSVVTACSIGTGTCVSGPEALRPWWGPASP